MIIKKITTGFVVQRIDSDLGRVTEQEFIASDDVVYEDEDGEPTDAPSPEPYLPLLMVQPEPKNFEEWKTQTSCARETCDRAVTHVHTHYPNKGYCAGCARLINKFNEPMLIVSIDIWLASTPKEK